MTVEPPSSGRPTGPPSGPLSGPTGPPPPGPPSQPPQGPPSQPSGGGGAHEPEPHRRPWWQSAPRVAVLAAVVVAAVALALVFTRSGGGSGTQSEVFLQAAGKTGPDPFTESTATDSSTAPVSSSPATESAPANAVRAVDGGAPGLYGGTRKVSSCDVEKQIKALQAVPAKNKAFASVADVDPSGVPAYLRSLTPVQLRMDTRVTNHGYRGGAATSYQAVLQTGTAVLVDDHGVPRVRCACGNPLTPPVAQQTTPRRTGDFWPSYSPSKVVVVTPAPLVVNVFVLYDADHREWIARPHGDTGRKDRKTAPPTTRPSPSVSGSTTSSAPPSSPSSSPSSSQPSSPPSSKSKGPSSEPPTSAPSKSEPPSSGSSAPGSSAPPSPPASEGTTTTESTAPGSTSGGPPSDGSSPAS